MSSSESKSQAVNLATLSLQQLSSIKKQLDDELEHLTTSFTKLRAAQAKFRECIVTIKKGVADSNGVGKEGRGKEILVPLTTSLYVPGHIADSENVIVDVGTGFYVEKSTQDATRFYESKVDELGNNLKDLEAIVQGKSNNLRAIEDVLRQKVVNESGKSS